MVEVNGVMSQTPGMDEVAGSIIMIGGVEASAELNAEADAYALGPESNERRSAAVILTLFCRVRIQSRRQRHE